MTLIDYFNQFWKEDEEKHFTQAETRLYFYLLYLWNYTGRKEWFECKTSMIEHFADINPMTLTRCRKSLKDRKLLDFKQGSAKGKYPYYSLIHVKDNVKDNVKVDVNDVLTHIEYRDIEKEDNSIELSKKPQEDSSERMDWTAFEQTFNQMMPPGVPQIKGVKEDRRKKVKARIKEYGKAAIMIVFNKVVESDFLSGRNRKPNDTWKCNFDFIFSKDGFRKILEGNYDNHGAINNQNSGGNNINSGAVQNQFSDYLRENFGFNGKAEDFEEFFNQNPYGG